MKFTWSCSAFDPYIKLNQIKWMFNWCNVYYGSMWYGNTFPLATEANRLVQEVILVLKLFQIHKTNKLLLSLSVTFLGLIYVYWQIQGQDTHWCSRCLEVSGSHGQSLLLAFFENLSKVFMVYQWWTAEYRVNWYRFSLE